MKQTGIGWWVNRCRRLPLLAGSLLTLLTSASCSADAQERRVRNAVAAAFPDGPRRCLPLPNEVVGNHVARGNAVLWYPSDGPTAPTRHMFVLWAGREDEPVPTLVAELAKGGVLRRSVVEANIDVQRQWMGPEVREGPYNLVSHPTLYAHDRASFRVAIYETPPYSPDFQYAYDRAGNSVSAFPSRVYDGPLPPSDQNYVIPLTTPYAADFVSGACVRETLDEVVSVETKTLWTGAPYVEAKVTFKQTAPAWMGTPAFREAALGPNTPSLTAPRPATLLFRVDGDKLIYTREDRP